MARGIDQRYNSARIVSLDEYKRRNHPATAAGGGGKKPPKTPKTRTGGGGERPEEPEDAKGNKKGRSPFDKFIGKVFPEASGYDVESQPDFYGNAGRLSDFNPKNNPYIYKKKDDEDGK